MPSRILSVQSTAFPNGEVISYSVGMPALPVKRMRTEINMIIRELVPAEKIRQRLLVNLNQFK